MINEQSFYDIVDIKEEEKESARVFLNNRGITEHIRMCEFLFAFLNRKPTYSEVATAFRYDKRIRRIIYKYLGLLEEMLRAYLTNRYETIGDIPNYRNGLIKKQESLKYKPLNTNAYEFVNELLFSNLINIVKNLNNDEKELIFGSKVLNKNLKAVVVLRNAISHNRTLLNYRCYEEVSLDKKVTSSSLYANVENLCSLLPFEVRNRLRDEISGASFYKSNSLQIQSYWILLDFYLIVIKL